MAEKDLGASLVLCDGGFADLPNDGSHNAASGILAENAPQAHKSDLLGLIFLATQLWLNGSGIGAAWIEQVADLTF